MNCAGILGAMGVVDSVSLTSSFSMPSNNAQANRLDPRTPEAFIHSNKLQAMYGKGLMKKYGTNLGKKRRKRDKYELIPDTLAINDCRRSYHKIFDAIMGLNEFEVKKVLSRIVADPANFVLVVSAIEDQNPFGPVYIELRGLGESLPRVIPYKSSASPLFSIHL